MESDIGRHILQDQRATKDILRAVNALRDVVEGFLRIGNGEQIMQAPAVYARPAQMIGNPARLQAIRQSLEREQIVIVAARRSKRWTARRRASRSDNAHASGRAAELGPARDHVVLADDLEPIEGRIVNQNLCGMVIPEPDAEAEKFRSRMYWAGERLCRLQVLLMGSPETCADASRRGVLPATLVARAIDSMVPADETRHASTPGNNVE